MTAASLIWVLASIWALLETAHYGWNMTAKSDAEMICDGIAFLLFALAILAGAIEAKQTRVTIHNNISD